MEDNHDGGRILVERRRLIGNLIMFTSALRRLKEKFFQY